MSEVAWYATVTSGSEVVGVHPHNANCAAGCKPVVVIDPEDREQVRALMRALWDGADGALMGIVPTEMWIKAIPAALRSLIPAEKPEEPTGLGAVVEDAEGRWWSRLGGTTDSPWHHGVRGHSTYADIAATKVLSPGVPSC